jgi:hypothetical protein
MAKEDGQKRQKEWLANKDWDLREREGDIGSWSGSTNRTEKLSSSRPLDTLENTVRKRLHVKQSINHTLNSLKAYSPASATEPASPLGEYTFYPPFGHDIDVNNEISGKRLSLQHIHNNLGQDVEPEPLRVHSVLHNLGSKYSLLNLFRKAGDTLPRLVPSPYQHPRCQACRIYFVF